MNRKTVERIFEKNYQTALKLEYIRKPYDLDRQQALDLIKNKLKEIEDDAKTGDTVQS